MVWSTGASNVSSIVVRASGTVSGYVVANGCSSSVSNAVPVTVNPTPSAPTITANRPTTFCQGDSVVISSTGTESKLWSNGSSSNSIVAKTTGVYSVQAFALGCTSSVSNSISVLVNAIPATPTLTAATATTFCSGDSLRITSSTGTGMVWSTGASNVSSIVVRASGTVSGYVVANGCSSSVSNAVPVTVNPTPSAPTITANRPTTFCQGDSVVISSTGTESKLWSNGSSSNSIVAKTTGVYSVQAFALGCTSSVSNSISVLVNAIPATPTLTAATATTFCSGDSLRITSSTGTGMVWSTGASNVSSVVVRASGTVSGYVVANGCSSSVSNAVAVTVNPTPSAPTIISSRNPQFCLGDSVQLTFSGTGTPLWNNGSTQTSIWIYQSQVVNVQSVLGSCTSSVSLPTSVLVSPVPTAPVISSASTSFCSNDSLLISSNISQGMVWSTGATSRQIYVRSNNPVYGYVLQNGCASVFSNILQPTVINSPLAPTIVATGNTTFCQGDSVRMTSNSSSHWSTGDSSISIVVRNSGTITARNLSQGCYSDPSNSIQVVVNPIPSAPFVLGRDTAICQGDSIRLILTPSQGAVWSTGSTDSTIYIKNSGVYSAYRMILGCSSGISNAVRITVNPRPLPPTITPSGTSLTFCLGDSMTISSSSPFGNTWNTGDTTATLVVRNNSPYFVKTTNAFGCSSAFSSPVNATVLPLPAAPQIKRYAYTLISDSLQVQWFFNGIAIPGAINNKLIIQWNGTYTCGVRNGLNCWSYSAPILIKDAVLGDVDIDKELLPTEKALHTEFQFSVYPNPTKGQLNVLWRGESAVGLLEVFDGSGRKVASKVRSNESQSIIDLEHLKPGMYWIRYSDNLHTETQKFIIQR